MLEPRAEPYGHLHQTAKPMRRTRCRLFQQYTEFSSWLPECMSFYCHKARTTKPGIASWEDHLSCPKRLMDFDQRDRDPVGCRRGPVRRRAPDRSAWAAAPVTPARSAVRAEISSASAGRCHATDDDRVIGSDQRRCMQALARPREVRMELANRGPGPTPVICSRDADLRPGPALRVAALAARSPAAQPAAP